MRKIKFRYKIEGRDKLLYDTDKEFGYLTPKRNIIAGSMGGIFKVEDEMQFIGIDDKEGKEIYEEDDVNCNILPSKGVNHKAKIKFIDSCFFIVMQSGTQFPICTNDYFLKVIGNTYENPELLKKGEK